MTRAQAERLAAIMAAAFTERERGWTADELLALATRPGALLVEEPGGFALARLAADEAEILTIAVVPTRQSQGTGTRLLGRLIGAARTAGATRLFLEAGAGNTAALALYTRAGFREVGRRPDYLRHADGSREDAVVMSHSLTG